MTFGGVFAIINSIEIGLKSPERRELWPRRQKAGSAISAFGKPCSSTEHPSRGMVGRRDRRRADSGTKVPAAL
ncbi:MAG: hypothetical protein AAB784_00155, partial [Patescibacteria group bacterium]